MVSGKFPARLSLQSVSQAFARRPWVAPIQLASALPRRSPSPGIATTLSIWLSRDSCESLLSCWLREPQRAEVAATQALAIAEEHGFPFVRNITRLLLGWARAHLGRAGEGVALIRQGLAGLAETGSHGWQSRII